MVLGYRRVQDIHNDIRLLRNCVGYDPGRQLPQRDDLNYCEACPRGKRPGVPVHHSTFSSDRSQPDLQRVERLEKAFFPYARLSFRLQRRRDFTYLCDEVFRRERRIDLNSTRICLLRDVSTSFDTILS